MKFNVFSSRTGSSVLTRKHKHSLCKAAILSCLFCFGGFSFASAAETWQFPETYTADDGVVYNLAFVVKDSSDNSAYYVSEDQTKYAIITFDSDYTSALSCTVYDNGTVLKGKANLSNSSSVVISGYVNEASGENSAIIGGSSNKVTAGQAVVVGGLDNDANGLQSVTMGGFNNYTSNSQSVAVGGSNNIANGIQSAVLGGFSNATTGPTTVIVGGYYNKIDGNSNASAVIVGGNYNYLSNSSFGSAIFGGKYNRSVGSFSYLVGGYENIGNGSYSLVAGGTRNVARSFWSSIFGGTDHVVDNSYGVAVGGQGSVVFGNWTTGIGGGSVGYKNETTGEYIGHATAIGHGAVTASDYGLSLGYQSTQDESGTISFGHDVGDISGYTVNWIKDSDGNIDYTSYPTYTENTYTSAYYNRLVKVADGIDDHDVATVEQLISSGTFDAENKKITLSSDTGKTVDIDLSKFVTGGGASYSAGTHISITDNVLDTVGLIAYDSSDMASAKLGGTNGTKLSNLKQATLSKVSTDAVTGSQLYATNLSISGFAADIKKNASDLAALSSSIADQQASVLTTISLVQTLSDGRTDLSLSNINSSGESKIKHLAKEVLDDYFANSATNVSIGEQPIATMEFSPTVLNQIAVVDESGTTATTDYVDQAVADKVSQSELAEKLAIKADISYVDNSVADKVSKTELATELARKADVSYVNDALVAKADLSYVDEALTKKTDVSYVNEKLESKADVDGSNIDVTKFTEKLGTGEVAKDNGNLVTGAKVYEATQNVLSESKSYTDTSVSALASQVDQAMGNMYGSLSKDINQGVAKASALAALKPLEYDPEDKFNFAVGYGHYKNGNSSAIGAFYYANANTMFNVGATIGNGDTAFNAGVSFKIGHGSTYNGVSKATLVAGISNQQKQLDAQNEEIEQLKQAVLALSQKQ